MSLVAVAELCLPEATAGATTYLQLPCAALEDTAQHDRSQPGIQTQQLISVISDTYLEEPWTELYVMV